MEMEVAPLSVWESAVRINDFTFKGGLRWEVVDILRRIQSDYWP
jgi:hypothetical protein